MYTLSDLPRDVLREIMGWLDLRTIGRVAQLNRGWLQLANPTARVTSLEKARRIRISRLRRDGRIGEIFAQLSAQDMHRTVKHPGVIFDDIKSPIIVWSQD